MDLGRSEEQQSLVDAFAELLAKHASSDQVRAAEPLGHDAELWRTLSGVGIVEMAVPEESGGWGATLLDRALVAEQVGAAAAPAPVIEAQCAAGLLAAVVASGTAATTAAGTSAAAEALSAVLGAERLITFAVRRVDGTSAPLLPAGAVADAAVVLVGDRLLLLQLDDAARQPVANLASAPLADVDLAACPSLELLSGPPAAELFERVLDEWLVLTAAALVGMAGRAHAIACEYARERKAWNVPIGSYQAVAHPLANGATAIDGARLLVAEAAWEIDQGRSRGRELAAMAFAFAAETAHQVTYDCVHFHGGYGFMLEYDAQLFYRRSRGWSGVWGEPALAYQRAARARYNTTTAPATTAPATTATSGVS
jgi:alkylation response protein AidB-like acyl-CoA dehydrogenase